ncbi:MAG: M13 family metallopeptidase [Patescibacteria group bacterium]
MTKKGWGFDTKGMDMKVRPQDDFFHHANGGWMKAHPIPPAESRWGSFNELRYKTDHQLRDILTELESKRSLPKGSPEQIIRDFQRSGMDMKRRNELGIKPLDALRKKITNAKDTTALKGLIGELHRIGVGVFFGSGIGQDSKNSERYILHMAQDGLGMPDRDYYLKDDAESVRVRSAYLKHAAALFRLMGRTPAEAKAATETLMRVETALAKASMKKEDRRDPEKTYHKMTVAGLMKLSPELDWKRYFTQQGAEVKEVIVMQPDFLKAVSKLLASAALEDLKTYTEWHLVNDFAGLLSNAFVKQSFSFYGTALTGTKQMKPLWRRVLGNVNGHVGELLGQIYVKKYFPAEAKKKMGILVEDLFTAYEARLKSLDWMTPPTKKKALKKLAALNRKIGYPDKWKSYKGLAITSDDYVGNVLRSNEFEHKREIKKLNGPIDRTEWHMYPQTVNAYFSPNLNDIVFPAGILQAPFFDMSADDALNYGAIGTVIGHEITHGFDDEGSQYDAKGNLKSWWTATDRKRFEAKAEKVRKQFDKYVVADGVKVNGKLTLGENIADLGGISIAYDAYQLQLARTGRKDVGGYTPEQRFFLGFALFERENVRPEYEKMQVLTDPHAPGKFRINGPVSNFDAFYEAYEVKKSDKMYRAPKDREMVW